MMQENRLFGIVIPAFWKNTFSSCFAFRTLEIVALFASMLEPRFTLFPIGVKSTSFGTGFPASPYASRAVHKTTKQTATKRDILSSRVWLITVNSKYRYE